MITAAVPRVLAIVGLVLLEVLLHPAVASACGISYQAGQPASPQGCATPPAVVGAVAVGGAAAAAAVAAAARALSAGAKAGAAAARVSVSASTARVVTTAAPAASAPATTPRSVTGTSQPGAGLPTGTPSSLQQVARAAEAANQAIAHANAAADAAARGEGERAVDSATMTANALRNIAAIAAVVAAPPQAPDHGVAPENVVRAEEIATDRSANRSAPLEPLPAATSADAPGRATGTVDGARRVEHPSAGAAPSGTRSADLAATARTAVDQATRQADVVDRVAAELSQTPVGAQAEALTRELVEAAETAADATDAMIDTATSVVTDDVRSDAVAEAAARPGQVTDVYTPPGANVLAQESIIDVNDLLRVLGNMDDTASRNEMLVYYLNHPVIGPQIFGRFYKKMGDTWIYRTIPRLRNVLLGNHVLPVIERGSDGIVHVKVGSRDVAKALYVKDAQGARIVLHHDRATAHKGLLPMGDLLSQRRNSILMNRIDPFRQVVLGQTVADSRWPGAAVDKFDLSGWSLMITKVSEMLGMIGGTHAASVLQGNLSPGHRLVPVLEGKLSGRDVLDAIYQVIAPTGSTAGFVLLENKGPGAPLGKRQGLDGKDYEQGRRENFAAVIDAMVKSKLYGEVLDELQGAFDKNRVAAFYVRALVEHDGGGIPQGQFTMAAQKAALLAAEEYIAAQGITDPDRIREIRRAAALGSAKYDGCEVMRFDIGTTADLPLKWP
ncbi:hypothetical protein [Amycolatopsis sp. NPDC098790]|uniref:hypothetical protein n=1 Tax=Amycolatopsis sp. NPDC098790 TaxID=3363939 RepID=UPI00382A522D